MQEVEAMQDIRFTLPVDLVKAGDDGEMRIAGYASTADQDRQGESVLQRSLDISEFVNSGFFNLDHDGSKIIGYPDRSKCHIDERGMYVEGTLLKGVPEAERMYRTALALQKSGADRRLGFSIEGKVLSRNAAGLITKAKVYNVALTAQPVNPNCTWDVMRKSFARSAADTAEAGATGLTTETGQPLIPESLETAFRNLADILEQDDDAQAHLKALREILSSKGSLTKGEAALYFTLTRGLPLRESASLVKTIFDEEGIVA